ncbi:MAG TPA: glycosyltransferase [Phycisphaerae bacterium]|nr:glycosyltransferase [Phycisphaerae bacterium]
MNERSISVIIPTRNRLDDLLVTLERIGRDPYPRVEVLVGDDGSDMDPRPILAERFPRVRVVRSGKRVGPCELRNRLAGMSSGEILVGLDDDCRFESPEAFAAIVRHFAADPRLGLLSCRVRRPDGTLWPAHRGEPLRETTAFIACGFAVRHSAFEAVGGFDPAIFRAGEERDLAMRLFAAGWTIRHTDDIVADHCESSAERDHQFIHSHALRNELLFVVRYAPASRLPLRLVRQIASHAVFCARNGWWRALRVGLGGFMRGAPGALRRRRPVARQTWRRFLDLSRDPSADADATIRGGAVPGKRGTALDDRASCARPGGQAACAAVGGRDTRIPADEAGTEDGAGHAVATDGRTTTDRKGRLCEVG